MHAVSARGSTPLHWRLFLPRVWAEDPVRCAKAGVPPGLGHRTKPEIALELLDELTDWGLTPPPVVVADAAYGTSVAFRAGLAQRGIHWLLAVNEDTTVVAADGVPVTAWARRHPTIDVATVSQTCRDQARRVVYRPKTSDHRARSAWFATARVHIAGWPERRHIATHTTDRLLPERTLIVQWRHRGRGEIVRSWITDLPADTPLKTLVRHATDRWHIETDYREMEQALGLGDYEGRGYQGFHHHVTLVSAAHLFCLEQRHNPKDPATT